jgi:hypothetical protein
VCVFGLGKLSCPFNSPFIFSVVHTAPQGQSGVMNGQVVEADTGNPMMRAIGLTRTAGTYACGGGYAGGWRGGERHGLGVETLPTGEWLCATADHCLPSGTLRLTIG